MSGQLSSGEVFNYGIWSGGAAYADQADLQAVVDEFASSEWSDTTWRPAFLSILANDSHYLKATAYYYDILPGEATFEAQASLTGSVNQGTAATQNADQVSLCVSLHTGRTGRSYNGRFYLPGNGLAFDAGAQVNNVTVSAIADAAVLFLGGWIDANQVHTHSPVIVVNSPTLNLDTPVSSLSVDSRADIQRRRANRQTISHVETRPTL
jgi:hypothetical protein